MKTAVLISGPTRYLVDVVKQVDEILGSFEFGIFIHVWKEDLGNKRRSGENKNWFSIKNHDKLKCLMIQEPYSEEYVQELGYTANKRIKKTMFGSEKLRGSSINATFGMFTAIRILLAYIRSIPEAQEYTHILRLRTDNIFFNRHILDKIQFSDRKIFVGNNQLLGQKKTRICDHIWFSKRKYFEKCWDHHFYKIYRKYKRANKEPERTLALLKRRYIPLVKMEPVFLRCVDYNVVYSPSKSNDPKWVRDIIDSEGPSKLYETAYQFIDDPESEEIRKLHQLKIQESKYYRTLRYQARRIVGKVVKKLKKRLLGNKK